MQKSLVLPLRGILIHRRIFWHLINLYFNYIFYIKIFAISKSLLSVMMVLLNVRLCFVGLVLLLVYSSALGMVSYGIDSESRCIGSLVIGHEDDYGNMNFLRLEGIRNSYQNIKRDFPHIRQSTISTIEVHGNCCWEIYSGRRFEGEYHIFYPEEEAIYTDFQPRSIRKIECGYWILAFHAWTSI